MDELAAVLLEALRKKMGMLGNAETRMLFSQKPLSKAIAS
jgi:hypothetical protein